MSWEENEEYLPADHQTPAPRSAPALNPNANAFSFNPGASSFTPSWAPPPPAAAPAPAPAPALVHLAAPTTSHQPFSAPKSAPPAASHESTNGMALMDEDKAEEAAGTSAREDIGK